MPASADGVDLDAHRRLLPAADGHLADARDLRDLLREDACWRRRRPAASGSVSELSERMRIGESAGLTLR